MSRPRKRAKREIRDSERFSFTPGPWRACQGGKCPCRQVWSIPGDVPVFTAQAEKAAQIGLAHHKWGDAPDMIYGVIPESSTEANARLIAAAPDLYAACVLARAELSDHEIGREPKASVRDTLTRINAALAIADSLPDPPEGIKWSRRSSKRNQRSA